METKAKKESGWLEAENAPTFYVTCGQGFHAGLQRKLRRLIRCTRCQGYVSDGCLIGCLGKPGRFNHIEHMVDRLRLYG